MSEKLNDLIAANERAKEKYDQIMAEINEVSHQADNAISDSDKEKLKTKLDSLFSKRDRADQEEIKTKSKLDQYVSNQ